MKDTSLIKLLYVKCFSVSFVVCRVLFGAGYYQTSLITYKMWKWARSLRWLRRVQDGRTPKLYNPMTLKAYKCSLGKEEEYCIIAPSKDVQSFGPKFYDEPQKSVVVTMPEIYYSLLDSVAIVGGCNILLCKNDLAIFSEIERKDFKRHNFETDLTPLVSQNKILVNSEKSSQSLKQAISLCGLGSENLYHWLFEHVARLGLLESINTEYSNWPILVDETINSTPQLFEILTLYAPNHQFIFVERGQQFHVEKLLSLSTLLWSPFNLKKNEICEVRDHIISPIAIQFIRSRLKTLAGFSSFKRIFISRKSYPGRRRTNEDELVRTLSPLGFEVIYPENHTFVEQMAIFRDAEIIVGVTGAALANIVFCKPGTLIICLISARVQLGIFSNIAEYLDLNLVYLPGKGDLKFKNLHRDFNVDPLVLKKFISTATSPTTEQL